MEQRALSLTILSAKDLNKVNLLGKMDVYIIISIKGSNSNQKIKTPVDVDGGTNPTWNFQAEFVVDEAAARKNHLAIVFKVKCERALGDKDIGEVHIPMGELLQSPEAIDGKKQFVSYQVRKPDGKPKGSINFAYQFGDKLNKPEDQHSIAYPPPHAVGSSSAYPPSAPTYPPSASVYPPPAPVTTGGGFYAPPPHAQGYPPSHAEGYPPAGYPPPTQGGYPHPPQQGGYHPPPPPQYAGYGYPQQPSYGGYPPPPPPGYGYPPPQPGYGYAPPGQKPPKKNGKSGLGMGAGLLGGALGGLLIGDMLTDGGFVDMDFDF